MRARMTGRPAEWPYDRRVRFRRSAYGLTETIGWDRPKRRNMILGAGLILVLAGQMTFALFYSTNSKSKTKTVPSRSRVEGVVITAPPVLNPVGGAVSETSADPTKAPASTRTTPPTTASPTTALPTVKPSKTTPPTTQLESPAAGIGRRARSERRPHNDRSRTRLFQASPHARHVLGVTAALRGVPVTVA